MLSLERIKRIAKIEKEVFETLNDAPIRDELKIEISHHMRHLLEAGLTNEIDLKSKAFAILLIISKNQNIKKPMLTAFYKDKFEHDENIMYAIRKNVDLVI